MTAVRTFFFSFPRSDSETLHSTACFLFACFSFVFFFLLLAVAFVQAIHCYASNEERHRGAFASPTFPHLFSALNAIHSSCYNVTLAANIAEVRLQERCEKT
jgi:hypothetical protein